MNRDQLLLEIAEESLKTFDEVSTNAEAWLSDTSGRGSRASSLINPNTFTDDHVIKKLDRQSISQRDAVHALVREPAISRLIIEDETGAKDTIYICRGSAGYVESSAKLASYNSPIGKLASLGLGDDAPVKLGDKTEIFTVIERTGFLTIRDAALWDSKPSHFENIEEGTYTIKSLRGLLEQAEEYDSDDELDAILADSGVTSGIAHQVRNAMRLRDQPILDKFQDQIFRLPLENRLIILGPPGTGKTTTLIKRLGQKLNLEFLVEQEARVAVDDPRGLPHVKSWVMFTPTELLKHYVKEAFALEQVPASSERIQTWDYYRGYLSRNVLGILQSTTTRGFIHKDTLHLLQDEVRQDPRSWFDAFNSFHRLHMLGQMQAGIDYLASVESSEDEKLINDIKKIVSEINERNLVAGYAGLAPLELRIIPRIKELKEKTDKRIRPFLVGEFNKNKKFLHELAEFLV